MVELSIEQKAKAYDKALKVAEKYHNGTLKDVMETIFSELAESEDEKIRREMIFYFTEEIPQCSIQEHADKMKEFIAWLEKQGEQKSTAWSEEDEYAIRWIRTICNDFVKSYKISPASTKVVQERVDKVESWLNTIKDRVGCEATCITTREWNEEDEKMKDAIYSCVDSHYDGLAKTSLLIWLKSLKERMKGEKV